MTSNSAPNSLWTGVGDCQRFFSASGDGFPNLDEGLLDPLAGFRSNIRFKGWSNGKTR